MKVRLRGIRHQGERILRLAEKPSRLAVRQITAAASHQLGQNHKGRQIGAASHQVTGHRSGVGSLNSPGKTPARLHHLPTGIVYRGALVMAGSHQGKLVRNLGMHREDLRDIDVLRDRPDRFERPANFAGSIRFHVPEIDVAGTPEIENHDARFFVIPLREMPLLLGGKILGKGQSNRARAHLP